MNAPIFPSPLLTEKTTPTTTTRQQHTNRERDDGNRTKQPHHPYVPSSLASPQLHNLYLLPARAAAATAPRAHKRHLLVLFRRLEEQAALAATLAQSPRVLKQRLRVLVG